MNTGGWLNLNNPRPDILCALCLLRKRPVHKLPSTNSLGNGSKALRHDSIYLQAQRGSVPRRKKATQTCCREKQSIQWSSETQGVATKPGKAGRNVAGDPSMVLSNASPKRIWLIYAIHTPRKPLSTSSFGEVASLTPWSRESAKVQQHQHQ